MFWECIQILAEKDKKLFILLNSVGLGHTHSKTTEIYPDVFNGGVYTHVSTKSLGKIQSPLDTLKLEKGGDD